MEKSTRTKIVLAAVLVLALGIFLPPNINGVRFKDRLAQALTGAMGRDVKIGQVNFRLFPRPGFDLYNFQVMDDPAFSAEPLLLCGKVTADLRLTSLWQGRLEIANLKLTDDNTPPSLNLVYANGAWNVESLLLRVGQVPSAPTSNRRAEQRARFPYIEASGGRINLKIGPEKKPYTLTATDFAFWLASEDVWHMRMNGHPVRTDLNLNDTGTVKLEGDLRRSRNVSDMPVNLDLSWEKVQLGQFTSLVSGRDRGWRGGLNGTAQLKGILSNFHVTASADLNNFRRYDINRNQMPQLRARCLGDMVHGALDLRCTTPVEPGGLVFNFKWSAQTPRNYDLSMTATRVPMSFVAMFARHVRAAFPDDLNATGDLNAAFGFHARDGVQDWHGTGMTSAFMLQSSLAEKPFPVSPLRFHIGIAETSPALLARTKTKQAAQSSLPQPDAFTIDSFSVQMGPSTSLEIQGNMDGNGYWIGAKGLVPLERLLVLGKVTGFPTDITNTTASAIVDLNLSGPWANFASSRLHGTAHLQNVTSWITGVKDRLVISEADAQITDTELVLKNIKAQFEHSPVAFTGTVSHPWGCQGEPPCPMQLDLHADALSLGDAGQLLGAGEKGWNLPFFSDSSPGKLPPFRANGTLTFGQFTVADLPLEKFTAKLEVADKFLQLSHISAKLGGGTVDGDWKLDWSGSQPRYTATGAMQGVMLEKLPPASPDVALATSWVTGKADVKYSFRFEGSVAKDMLNSTVGKLDYTVSNGTSKALQLDSAKPLKFQSLQGSAEVEKQILRVLPSKFRAENRIYELSGTMSLADKQAKLKVTNNTARWDITGALDQPQIAAQAAAASSARKR
jgi:AsmA-like protein